MEVWNGIWKKNLVWNGIRIGRFLVWNGNGMEENCQYGIWKNRLSFHSIPCPAKKMLKVSDIAGLEFAKFMYRFHKFKVPDLFVTENYFTTIDDIHSYNTQSSSS